MKIFNRFCNNIYKDENTGDGDGSSDATPNANEGDANNNEDQVDDYSNIWNNDTTPPANASNDIAEVRIVNQPDVIEATPEEKLATHIEGLNLADGFNYDAMNNPETALAEMKRMQAVTYEAIIKDANKILDQRINTLRSEMQEESQNTIRGNDSINKMNASLNYTAKAEYKPIAEALLVKFQNKGLSLDKSIEQVGKYFQGLQKEIASTLPAPPANRINGQVFNDINNPGQTSEKDENWVDFLTAK